MISLLASPSVCVVDDEEADYKPILAALNSLYVSSVHILGNDIDSLPSLPFKRLQLVFLDLHLNNSIGKTAASHTANVFKRIVWANTAPIIVVIWSKYAQDCEEDEETEAELFKRTLLEAEPRFKGKLIFVEMPKPMPDDRPQDWTAVLRAEVENALTGQNAVNVLWTWDSMVRDASMGVGEGLTAIAAASADQSHIELTDALKDTMQRLAQAQGEGDFSPATAPGHLLAVLAQLLMDHLEHSSIEPLSTHGGWLAAEPQNAPAVGFAARMNGLLLTAAVSSASAPLIPGTVYRLKDAMKFDDVFGRDLLSLQTLCSTMRPTQEKWPDWVKEARPVLVEISPACDVAQNTRISSLLIAGLVVPASLAKHRKSSGDSFGVLPLLHLRWAAPGFPEQDAALIFCHRYKVAAPVEWLQEWIEPWFRLREMPTAALRAAHAGHSARIGYVLLP
jgi:hypothetical protein